MLFDQKSSSRFLLFLSVLLSAQDSFSGTLADTAVFKKLDAYGKCSKIAVANHPSFINNQVPFYLFSDSLDAGSVLKEIDPATGGFKTVDTQGVFDGVKDVDVDIDDFGGVPVFKWAISAKQKNTLPNGTPIDQNFLQSFAAKPAGQYTPTEIQDRLHPFFRHYIMGVPSDGRIYARASKLLLFKDGYNGPMAKAANAAPNYSWLGDKINDPNQWIDLGDGGDLEYVIPSEWDPTNTNPFETRVVPRVGQKQNPQFAKRRKFSDAFDANHKGIKVTDWTEFSSANYGGGSGVPYPFVAGKPFIYGGFIGALNLENFWWNADHRARWYDDMSRPVSWGGYQNDYTLPVYSYNPWFCRQAAPLITSRTTDTGPNILLEGTIGLLSNLSINIYDQQGETGLQAIAENEYNSRTAPWDPYTKQPLDKKIYYRNRIRGLGHYNSMLNGRRQLNFFYEAHNRAGITSLISFSRYDSGQTLSEADRMGKVPDRFGAVPDRGVAFLGDFIDVGYHAELKNDASRENIRKLSIGQMDTAWGWQSPVKWTLQALTKQELDQIFAMMPSLKNPQASQAQTLAEYNSNVLAKFPSIKGENPMSDGEWQTFINMFPTVKQVYYDPLFNRALGDITKAKKIFSVFFSYLGQRICVPKPPEYYSNKYKRSLFVMQTRSFSYLWDFACDMMDPYIYDLTGKFGSWDSSSFQDPRNYQVARNHDFSKAVKLSTGKKGKVFYVATLLNNNQFEVMAIANLGKPNEVEDSVIIPVEIKDLAVDNNGNISVVDKEGFVWWSNIDKILASVPNFNPALIQELVQNAQERANNAQFIYQAQQSQVDALKAQEEAIRKQLSAFPTGTSLDTTQSLEQQLQKVLGDMQTAITEAQNSAANYKTAIASLNTQLTKLKQDNTAAQTALNELTTSNAKLLQEQQALIDKRNENLKRFSQYTDALEKGLAALGIAPGSLSLKMDTLSTDFATQLGDIQKSITLAMTLKTNEINGLTDANKNLEAEITAINNEIAKLDTTNASDATRLTQLQQDKTDIMNQIQAAQTAIASKDELIAKNTTLIKTLTAAKDAYKAELDKVSAALSGVNISSDLKAILTSQKQSLGDKLQAVLDIQNDQISSLTSSITTLKSSAAQTQEQITELNNQLAQLKIDQAKALQDKSDLLAQKQTENEAKKQELLTLQQILEAESATAATPVEIAAKKAANEKLQTELDGYNASIATEQKQQQDLNTALTGFNSDLKSFIEKNNGTVDSTGTLSDILKKSIETLKSSATRLQQLITEQEANIALAEKEKSAAMAELDKLLSSPANSEDGKSVKDRILAYSEMMQKNLSDISTARESEKTRLLTLLQQAQSEFNTANGNLNTEITNIDDVNKAATARLEKLNALKQAQETLTTQLQVATAKLETDKQTFDKKLLDMQADIDAFDKRASEIKTQLDNILNSAGFTGEKALVNNTKTTADADDLLTKLNLILEVKDGLIAQLETQLASEKTKLDKKLQDFTIQFGANSPEAEALKNPSLSLDQKMAIAKTLYDKQLVQKQDLISKYNATATATRNTVNALFQQAAGDTGLSQEELSLASNPNIDIKELVPLLTKFLAAKDSVIMGLKNDLKDKEAYLQQQQQIQEQIKMSDAQRAKEMQAYQDMEARMQSKLSADASLQIEGAIGTLQFTANASLQQKFDQLMQFRKAQMQEMKVRFEQEKNDLNDQLRQVQAGIDDMSQQSAGLDVLNANQKTEIADLTKKADDLKAKITSKDQEIVDAKNGLQALVAKLQTQIDDLSQNNKKLQENIDLLELQSKDQKLTLEQKEKIIQQKEALILQYNQGLAIAQQKTASLAADTAKEQANLDARMLALKNQKDLLSQSQSAQDSLNAEIQAIIEQRKATEELNKQRVAELTALAEVRKARVAELEEREQLLQQQVDVLSSIIDQHIGFEGLPQEDQDRLINVMGAQGSLVKKMLTPGGLDESDVAPYQIAWLGQEIANAVKFANYQFPPDIAQKVATKVAVDAMINAFASSPEQNFSAQYQKLSDDNKAKALDAVPNIATLAQDEANFKMSVHNKILSDIVALVSPIMNSWATDANAPTNVAKSKETISNLITKDPATMRLSVLKVKLNVLFQQKTAEMKLQEQNYAQTMKNLETQVDSTKNAIAEAIKAGELNLQEAERKLDNLNKEKDKKLQDQKEIVQKLSDIYASRLEGSTSFAMSLLKRQSLDINVSRNIEFFEAKKTELMNAINDMRKAIQGGGGDDKVLAKMTLALNMLNRQYGYSPFVLPVAQKFSADGKIVHKVKLIDKTGQEVISGEEEIGTSEIITISFINYEFDPVTSTDKGTVIYINPSIQNDDKKVKMSALNRFDDRLKMQVVNRGFNLVSLEIEDKGTKLALTLVPSTTQLQMPKDLANYQGLLKNFDVKWLPIATAPTDNQLFYLEGLENPAFSEGITIRAHSSENNYKDDMHGYLSAQVSPDGSGYDVIYKPYISADYHAKPGNKESIFAIHQMDLNSGSEEALVLDFLNKIMTLDDTKIIDNNKGYTQADKALESLLQNQAARIAEIYNNPLQFEDFVLNTTDFIGMLKAKGELSAKDFAQLKEFGKKLQGYVIASEDASNLAKKTPGYKALIGEYDRKGKLLIPGLVNLGDNAVKVTFEQGDILILQIPDNMMIKPGDFAAGQAPAIVTTGNEFDPAFNLKIEAAPEDKFRILSHDGMMKLTASADGIVFKAKEDAAGDDLFSLIGSLGAVEIKNSNGFIAPTEKDKTKLVLTPIAQNSLGNADYTFKVIHRKKDSYDAIMVDIKDSLKTETDKELEVLLLEELAKNRSKLNQIVEDFKDFVQFRTTDATRADLQARTQRFINAILSDIDFAKSINQELIESLNGTLSLFDIRNPTYFVIKNQEGLVLKVNKVYNSGKTNENGQKELCYGLEFGTPEILNKTCFFKILPNPAKFGSYLIIGYSADANDYFYLTTTKTGITDNNNAPQKISVITGTSAADFMDDPSQTAVAKPEEAFEITGVMSQATIRSLNTNLQSAENAGYLASVVSADGTKRIQAISPDNDILFLKDSEGTKFEMKLVVDSEVAMLTSTTIKLPATLFNVLLEILKNPNYKDEEKSKRADDTIDAFRKLICDTDPSGQLKVKQVYIDRNLPKLITDQANEVYSMFDVLNYIAKFIKYDAQKAVGIKLSAKSQATLDALTALFKTQDTMAFIQQNIDRVFKPNGVDLSVALSNFQKDIAKLQPVISNWLTFMTGSNVEFTDQNSIDIQNIATMIIRTDMPAELKKRFSDTVDSILGNKSITEVPLLDLLNKIKVKLNPDLEVVGSKTAGPSSLAKMDLYSKLSLAEKMLITGVYRDVGTGTLYEERNADKAETILNSITEDDIKKAVMVNEFRAWIKNLKALVPIVRKTKKATTLGSFGATSLMMGLADTTGLGGTDATSNPLEGGTDNTYQAYTMGL